jgi:alpha-mannosidase
MLRFDRRSFLAWLGTLPLVRRPAPGAAQQPVIDVRPSALFQQPDGRRNLVRVIVSGLSAPAARASVTDGRGALVGTAGLLPSADGVTLSGELWVPLSQPSDFQVDVQVGRDRAARRRLRLTPPKRWTLYWLSSIHTDVGYTDFQERTLEVHRKNLDAALAWLTSHRDFRFTAECALQVLSHVENRSADAGDALVQAIREAKIGWQALFANMLTGLLDHDTLARLVWPAGKFARERGLTFLSAQITDVPGQTLTFPMMLAASGVKYLASGPNPERAVPLLPASAGGGEGMAYPQLYYWEGPDGSRVLHWRAHHYGDGTRFGFDAGPDEMGRRLSDWLLNQPAFLAQNWPYDIALLYGADWQDNALLRESLVKNVEEFGRRFMWPRIVTGRAEDFFREVERRYGTKVPVRRGDTGLYWEDGAASTAAELAAFRSAQLAARAVEILALWDGRIESPDDDVVERRRERVEARTAMWRELLLFGEHTWGAAESVDAPASRQTVAQWEYKKRFIDAAAAGARDLINEGLLRLGRASRSGRGRLVFNAGSWERTDVARVAGGAGKALAYEGRELASVDLDDGDALVVFREVPPLGYVALTESDRTPRPPSADGDALEASAGGFTVKLDGASGAIRSLAGPDGKERVKTSEWSGLNQLIYARGGERSALWTSGNRDDLKNPPQLEITQARFTRSRREKLPGIGVRLITERALDGFPGGAITSSVTLYDELPWVDVENRITRTPTFAKEALYVAFPFAFIKPVVEVEVPLGRMTVERDQQPGSCRDWYCHTHWVWLHEGNEGLLWSAPDTPLFTLNDLFRGQWRRSIVPDGTLFAYAMNNYWHTNYAAAQGGGRAVTFRFRISLLAPGDVAEPVRRGWAACDPLYVSPPYTNEAPGPLITKDRALFYADKNVMIVGAKSADDGEGAIVKLLDVSGQARAVGVWPAAYAFKLARRTTLVEQNGDPLPVGSDGRASIDLPAWGIGTTRLFTPAEGS